MGWDGAMSPPRRELHGSERGAAATKAFKISIRRTDGRTEAKKVLVVSSSIRACASVCSDVANSAEAVTTAAAGRQAGRQIDR